MKQQITLCDVIISNLGRRKGGASGFSPRPNSLLSRGREEKQKNMQHAKEAYLKEVDCSSWEEAVEELPEYSRIEVLSNFVVPKGRALSNKFQVRK